MQKVGRKIKSHAHDRMWFSSLVISWQNWDETELASYFNKVLNFLPTFLGCCILKWIQVASGEINYSGNLMMQGSR